MIRISNIKLPPEYTGADIEKRLRRIGVKNQEYVLSRLSLDARKKEEIHYLASFDLESGSGLRPYGGAGISEINERPYTAPEHGVSELSGRPVIIGAGPAGMFAGLLLALYGYAPLIIERGAPADERMKTVNEFWENGSLDPDSNPCFGEGGAGTFSDGKLTTGIKDKHGRIRQILRWFCEAGADEDILYWHKPHLGSDRLPGIMMNIRKKTEAAGGEYRFHTRAEKLILKDGAVRGLLIKNSAGKPEELSCGCVILACGHSARDTIRMLYSQGVPVEAKNFAVGLRIEHPAAMISRAQYGEQYKKLPTADYKLTGRSDDGHGVYSFCMCPGGSVINSSTEAGMICVNGMSLKARDGRNSNSAIVVGVGPADFGEGVFAGMDMQRKLEKAAWRAGNGNIPVQLLGDFMNGKGSVQLGDIQPDIKGAYSLSNLREVLTDGLSSSIISVMPYFGKRIEGFDRYDAVLSGVESRTSSPVRINRDANYESSIKGLFPCGEGAGYAGGITSAAADGMKTAEEIIGRYRPWI
ncbi:MAG: FAD-dependent oxidoreductase [Lachnospiraceae bacterium]|nr:FAD-dependent oxidoreductase [Lachnospiraceae bacterium]